jgi:hypothetical protein
MNVDWMVENKVGLVGFDLPERFEYVKVDEYFPTYITENLDRWQHMIVPNAEKTVEDLY